jgi:hypothetical protein
MSYFPASLVVNNFNGSVAAMPENTKISGSNPEEGRIFFSLSFPLIVGKTPCKKMMMMMNAFMKVPFVSAKVEKR